MKGIDLTDPAVHAAIAFVVVSFGGLFSAAWCAFILSSAFWFGREVWQDYEKGYSFPNVWPLRFSTQKWAEFGAGVAGGLLGVFAG